MKRILAVLPLLLVMLPAFAQLSASGLFTDHMVLQRDRELQVWGTAAAREKVTVAINGASADTKAAKDGSWRISLPAMPAGGPYEMTITGKREQLVFGDVWLGDVWICSGQSNMEWPLYNINSGEEEVRNAHQPMIRMFEVPRKVAFEPQTDLPEGTGPWMLCTPENARNFSAVGYLMARDLQPEIGVAIGLISTNWGGTIIETWTSGEAIVTDPDFSGFDPASSYAEVKAKAQAEEARMKEYMSTFPDQGPDMDGDRGIWAATDFSTDSWKTMNLPTLWDSQEPGGFDGVIWFRKTITLTQAQASMPATLSLGPIDDIDITWVNGQKVGSMKVYNDPRVYEIPAGVLKAGDNVIAVRVLDTGGGGGIYGKPEDMVLTLGSQKLSLAGPWIYRPGEALAGRPPGQISPNSGPTLLFNGMLRPLIPYVIKGAIWYQGESNADRAKQYQRLFPLMINDWRNRWGYDFPFLWVQLANYMAAWDAPEESAWAELREAQSMTLSLPNTGQAVIIDIGEAGDIHPRNKQDVGNRLAKAALHVAYGQKLVYSGPVYESVDFEENAAVVQFSHTGSGLEAHDRYGYVRGFVIAGKDKEWHWAQARIEGNKVRVWSDAVQEPVAVRYAWANNPDDANLYNAEGLPAGPFRTDDWPMVTE